MLARRLWQWQTQRTMKHQPAVSRLLSACSPRSRAFAALLALCAVELLSGCLSLRSDLAPVRDAWLGASYDEVVSRWGAPVRSATLDDGRLVYTWLSDALIAGGSVRPSIGVSAGSGMGVGIGIGVTSGAGQDRYVSCERTLVFREGRVIDQTWYGATDYCASFRRG